MPVQPPYSQDDDCPIGHRQYEAGFGTPVQRVNYELQALGHLFQLSALYDDAHLELDGMPDTFDTLKRLRWIATSSQDRPRATDAYQNRLRNMMASEATVALRLLDKLSEALR